MPEDKALLEVDDVTLRFGGLTALDQVSFEIREGEILGLIGPNGSGKSTIFDMISGTLKPTAGSVRLDGREIAGMPPSRICHMGIGRTSQIPRPFEGLTVFENVGYKLYEESDMDLEAVHRRRAHAVRRGTDDRIHLVELPGLPRGR